MNSTYSLVAAITASMTPAGEAPLAVREVIATSPSFTICDRARDISVPDSATMVGVVSPYKSNFCG